MKRWTDRLRGITVILAASVPVIFAGCSHEGPAAEPRNKSSDGTELAAPSRPPTNSHSSTPRSTRPPAASLAKSTESTPSTQSTESPRPDTLLHGQVRLPDGKPAAETTVTVGQLSMRKAQSGQFEFQDLETTVTAADGTYRFPLRAVEFDHLLFLRAEKPGLARMTRVIMPQRQSRAIRYGSSMRQDVHLRPASSVRGVVVDETSQPLAGVRVQGIAQLPDSTEDAAMVMVREETVTAADGTFSLDQLVTGTVLLMADSDTALPAMTRATAPSDGMRLTLTRGTGTIRGHIFGYRSREGLASATVTLLPVPERENRHHMLADIRPRTTVSNQLGQFEFSSLGAGRYLLSATRNGWRPLSPEALVMGGIPLQLGSGETTEGVAVFLYPGHTVRGLVQDARSHDPISGVKVTASGHETQTDGEGEFLIAGVFPEGGRELRIQASKEYYVPSRRSPTELELSLEQLETSVTVELSALVKVSGKVLLHDLSPVAGAEVSIFSPHTEDNREPKTVTDASGAYELLVEPNRLITLTARAEGYPPATTPNVVTVNNGPVSGADIILSPPTSVGGRVTTFDGRPGAGAKVEVKNVIPYENQTIESQIGIAVADAQGQFLVHNVPGGQLVLKAEHESYTESEPVKAEISAGKPKLDVELVLRKSHFVAGTVFGPDNKPLAGVSVSASPDNGGLSNRTTKSGEDGKYRLEGLLPGDVTVTAQTDNGERETREHVRVNQENINFILGKKAKSRQSREVAFMGRVVDWTTGSPVADFTIHRHSNSLELEKDPAEPGTFVVKNYRPGTSLRFTIEAPDYQKLDTESFIPKEQDGKYEEIFRLGKGGTIIGRMVDSNQAPLAEVAVLLKGTGMNWEAGRRQALQTVVTGPDGRFRMEGVGPGLNRLIIQPKPPRAEQDRTVTVEHNAESDMGDIVLADGGRVFGRVVSKPRDAPLAGKKVMLNEPSRGVTAKDAVTDEQGRFEFTGLKAVSYSIQVSGYGLNQTFTLREAEQKEVVLAMGGATVHGKVLRAGAGTQAEVRLTQPDGTVRTAYSSQDGSYKIEGALAGKWQLSAEYNQSGRRQARQTIEIPEEGEVEADLIFPGGRIVGRVEDEDGEPVSGVRIAVQMAGRSRGTLLPEHESVMGQSYSDGSFAIEDLAPGTYGITARLGVQTALVQGVVVPESGASEQVVVKLDKGGGTVVSTALNLATGEPIREAWLILSTPDGRFDHGQRRDANGVMTVEGVPPGTYDVQVSSFGFSINDRKVEVKEGETVRLDDVLYDAGAIRWRIVDKSGAPMGDASCTLTPDDPSSIESPRRGGPGGDGMWIVRGLYPGIYTGTILTPTGETRTVKHTILAHEVIDVTTKVE